MGDSPHRSYSQLTSWLRCGMAYKLERIDKVPEIPAWWFVGGNAVHKATEIYDRDAMRPDAGSQDDNYLDDLWMQCFADEIQHRQNESDVPLEEWRKGGRATKEKPNKEDGEWWQEAGRGCLQNWVDFRHTYPNWQIATINTFAAIEIEFNVWVGSIPVRGYIDRVFTVTNTSTGETENVIVDLKTGSTTPKSAQQLGFYATLIEQTGDPRPTLGCYFNARKGDITVPENLEVFSTPLFTSMLEPFDFAVKNNIHIPNVGQACMTCGVARHCPAVAGDLAAPLL